MKIKIVDPTQKVTRLRKLAEGDWFVRWASPRKFNGCRVYMKMHDHSRLQQYCDQDECAVVDLKYARLKVISLDQPVLRIVGEVEVELEI